MNFIQIIQQRISNLEDQIEIYTLSDISYYQKHIIRLKERIDELRFCLGVYQEINSK